MKRILHQIRGKLTGKFKKTAARAEGKFLSLRKVDDYLRFVIFLALIGMAYIWNTHYAEKQVREWDIKKQEVKSLKARYTLKQSNLSAATRFTEIRAIADSLGLEDLDAPPYKLVIPKKR
jgi:hypothetical protein